ITARGMMLRTPIADLRTIGRATQGVRLIRLEPDDKVVAVARLAPDETGHEPEPAQDSSDQS
ncbi:MAG: DNA gyrase C-terminal beta-propeller domain-containing protein, partial [Phycisphaerae bacterium]